MALDDISIRLACISWLRRLTSPMLFRMELPPSRISSLPPRTCSVMLFISESASKTCFPPVACSCIAARSSSIRLRTVSTDSCTWPKAALVSWLEFTIVSMRDFISPRLDLISFDCTEDCSARWRISSATTAKPRPASPAWAASIAAFMASRFV